MKTEKQHGRQYGGHNSIDCQEDIFRHRVDKHVFFQPYGQPQVGRYGAVQYAAVQIIHNRGICNPLSKAGKNTVDNHVVQNDTVYGPSAGAVKSFPERYFQYNTEKGIQRVDNIVKAKYGFFLK